MLSLHRRHSNMTAQIAEIPKVWSISIYAHNPGYYDARHHPGSPPAHCQPMALPPAQLPGRLVAWSPGRIKYSVRSAPNDLHLLWLCYSRYDQLLLSIPGLSSAGTDHRHKIVFKDITKQTPCVLSDCTGFLFLHFYKRTRRGTLMIS